MKTVDLNFELMGLNGESVKNENQVPVTAGELIAGVLMSESKGDAVKFFDWAMTFNKKQPVQMDQSDLTKLRTLVETSEKITILVKGPVIKYLDSVK